MAVLDVGSTVVNQTAVASDLGGEVHEFDFLLLRAFKVERPIFEQSADVLLDPLNLLDG